MFSNLQELITSMPDEKTCREYLEQQIWNGKPVCPFCNHDRAYKLNDGKTYKCASNKCYKKFTVTVGTVFEASNIPLNKWFIALYFATAHKKGISSIQLGKNIGVTQRTAWFMMHRIREFMRAKENVKLDNIVEIDEVYMGGKVGYMSKSKRAKLREENQTYLTKTMVMGMIERGGNLKLIKMGKANGADTVQPIVREHVDTDAVLITDGLSSYQGLGSEYAAHEAVNHSADEYVRDVFHTNTIEGAFSHFRRSIYGCYHQVTPKHLSRYCDETVFRYNSRKIKDYERFTASLQMLKGRLKYKDLVRKEEPQEIEIPAPIQPELPKGLVMQIQYGKLIATYPNVAAAAKAVGVAKSTIWKVVHGLKRTSKGCEWKYS